jgi:hypothetical protein
LLERPEKLLYLLFGEHVWQRRQTPMSNAGYSIEQSMNYVAGNLAKPEVASDSPTHYMNRPGTVHPFLA